MIRRLRTPVLAVLGIVVLFGLGAGGRMILVSDTSTAEIVACKSKSGAIRVVATARECVEKESVLRWNVVGPEGPTGPQGEIGPRGPAGPAGPEGGQGDWLSECWLSDERSTAECAASELRQP